MTEPERVKNGSWWATLPGALTGFAALLTAVGGLLVALQQTGFLPKSSDQSAGTAKPGTVTPAPRDAPSPIIQPPAAQGTTPQIEGVGIKLVAARRAYSRDAAFIDLQYAVTTGWADVPRHDPLRFVRLVSGGTEIAPVSASVSAMDLAPNSRQDISVRFPSPPEGAPIAFRFGERRHLDLAAQLVD